MRGYLASPRRQRRLARAGVALAFVAGVAALAVFLPTRDPAVERLRPGPVVREEPEVPITPRMRAAINSTLERFVPAALSRSDGALAWELAGPGLRGTSTRADWLVGDLPVHPYPLKEQRFDGWRRIYAHRDRVALDLIVRPRPEARVGEIAFAIDLVRRGDRWLVDSMYPAAIWSAPHEQPYVSGPADVRVTGKTAKIYYNPPKLDTARLSAWWIALPVFVLAGGVLVGIAFGISIAVQNRRAAARYAALRERL